VIDADASQTKVIEEVRRGASLVVQGPPGTGKSQTITNLIAAAAHDGKLVLFVAEKMAALSVVHDRLVRAGLRDLCLELHSRTANKKALAQELGRTLMASAKALPGAAHPARLRATRDQLNQIAALLHEPLAPTGDTPFQRSDLDSALQAGCRWRKARDAALERYREEAFSLDPADISERIRIGVADRFAGLPSDLSPNLPELNSLRNRLASLLELAGKVAAVVGVPVPQSPEEIVRLIDLHDWLLRQTQRAESLIRSLFNVTQTHRLIAALDLGENCLQARQAAEARLWMRLGR
jgi:hypothetical protein